MRDLGISLELKAFAANWFKDHDSEMYKLACGKDFRPNTLRKEALEVLSTIKENRLHNTESNREDAEALVEYATYKIEAENALTKLAKAAKVCHDKGWQLSETWDAVKSAWE